MHKPEIVDIEFIQRLYDEATAYANTVGFIDWPTPFPLETLEAIIANDELYVWGDKVPIAAAKISLNAPEMIWGEVKENDAFLYLGKLVGSQAIRNTGYIEDIVMNDAKQFAALQDKSGIRLDCLADNKKLCTLYSRLGYESQGFATFWSTFQAKQLVVNKFQIEL